MQPPEQHNRFSLVLVATWACNSTCEYCFQTPQGGMVRTDDLATMFARIRDVLTDRRIGRLDVYWQGGEVMAVRPTGIAERLDAIDTVMREGAVSVQHHMQTNLLLYHTAWAELVKDRFGGRLSSSLDYPNLYRKAPGLTPDRFNEVWLGKKARAEGDGLTVSVITLPNPESFRVGAEAFYRYFLDDVGVQNVQINFPFPGAGAASPPPLDRGALTDFLEGVYDHWIASDRALNLNPFAALERRFRHGTGSLPCTWSFSCAHNLLAVAPTGAIGQCDCWLSPDSPFGSGNLLDPAGPAWPAPPRSDPFVQRPALLASDPECARCAFWSVCFGGCPIRAYAFTGKLATRDWYCSVYQSVFARALAGVTATRRNAHDIRHPIGAHGPPPQPA